MWEGLYAPTVCDHSAVTHKLSQLKAVPTKSNRAALQESTILLLPLTAVIFRLSSVAAAKMQEAV